MSMSSASERLNESVGISLGYMFASRNFLKNSVFVSPLIVFSITSGFVLIMSCMMASIFFWPNLMYDSPTICVCSGFIWSLMIVFAAWGKM